MPYRFEFQYAHTGTIDSKNRLFIPASHREKLEEATSATEGFVANTSADNRIWLYPKSYYPEVVAEAKSRAKTDEDFEWVAYHYNANAADCPRDAQNRILIPADMLKETGTGKDVCVVGMTDHLEVWNVQDWTEFSRKARQNAQGALGLRNRKPETAVISFADTQRGPDTPSV